MKPVNKDAYYAAVTAVQQIDKNLDTGRRHYRTRNGQLLLKFDQVHGGKYYVGTSRNFI